MSLPMSYDASFLLPGQLPSLEAIEQDLTSVIWQPLYRAVTGLNGIISGASRDDGNTGFTDVLRPGLLLTRNANKEFVHWGSVVNKATDPIEAVLLISMKMQKGGVNTARFMGHVLFGGYVKTSGLIIPGNVSAGIVGDDDEDLIRRKMLFNFVFDDDPSRNLGVQLFAAQFAPAV